MYEFPLSEVVELVIDNRGRNPKSYSDEGVPVIDNYLIKSDGEPKLDEVKRYIDEDTYSSFIRKYNQPDDVLLTLVGNGYGYVAISPQQRTIIIQNTIGLRCSENFDNTFLYYLLKGNREHLMNLDRGAAQPSIKVGDVLDLVFKYPPLNVQKEIGIQLKQLDNKIQLNRETNQTLEAMAQALFKSWFVDFDPVFDNIIAHNLAHNNAPLHNIPEPLLPHAQRRLNVHNVGRGSARQTASQEFHHLFPQAFEQSDEPSVGIQGWIPKGWGAGSLESIATALSGFAFKGKDFVDQGEAVLKIKNIKSDRTVDITDVQRVSMDVAKTAERFKLNDGDIVIAMTGATVGKFGVVVSREGESYYLNQRVCKLVPKVIGADMFLYSALSKEGVEESILDAAQGSAQPNISASGILSIKQVVPTENIIKAFSALTNSSYLKMATLKKQSFALESLRDTLLPKLISGELRIPDAEQATEALAK